jgi:membrane-associated phospholipid phosphatase
MTTWLPLLSAIDWDLGPATSLVLLAGGLGLTLLAGGALAATHPWRGPRPNEEIAAEIAHSPSPLWAHLRRFLRARVDPKEATGLALTVALVCIWLAAIWFGALADMVAAHTGLARWDAAAADWGARHATRASTDVLIGLADLGSTMVVIAVALAGGLYERLRWRRWNALIFMLVVVAGQNLIANGVKLLVHRQRPLVPHLVHATGWSFPSGHAAASAATYAALALLLGRGRLWPTKAWLGTAAAAVAVAVAASRVLLGVHWLTDVFAGSALGFGWFAVCSIAFGGGILRFGATAERATAQAEAERGTKPPEPPADPAADRPGT